MEKWDKFTVTDKLMRDMTMCYQIKREGKQRRDWRSNSIKNRYFIISKEKEKKAEWIILPNMPSVEGDPID